MAKPRQRRSRSRTRHHVPEGRHRLTAAEIIGVVLSIVWVAGVSLFFVFGDVSLTPDNRLSFVVTLIAIFMPVAMIWIGAAAARSNRIMREESARLQAAIDRLTAKQARQTEAGAIKPTVEAKLDEIARAARKTETALTTFTSIRQPLEIRPPDTPAMPPQSAKAEANQTSLAFDAPPEDSQEPVTVADFLRALNFPDNAEDAEGFRALRRALHDRQTAQLITAAKDVIEKLAEDGIYMDDMSPDRARPEVWRRFARGERGRAVAGLGGVRDRSSLAISAGRMREDTDFRTAAHHFLRRFDEMLATFEPMATDAELAELTNTRSARAFMLLGRVTGTFA